MSTTDELREHGSDLVTYAARLVRTIRRTVDQPAGIRVLSLLDEHGPLGVTQLAEIDRCSQPTMSGTIGTLLEQGLVSKSPNPEDARSSLIRLTRAGRQALARFRRHTGEVVADRLSRRGRHCPDDVATAVAVLREILDPDHAREGAQ